jgi:hypothetical protein
LHQSDFVLEKIELMMLRRMWHFASGSCFPSAAEDGDGHQTDGVNVPLTDLCGINQKLDEGCPGDSTFQDFNTFYHGAPGEPWDVVPTYFATRKCDDGSYVCHIMRAVLHFEVWS